jgi:hypothetical protein
MTNKDNLQNAIQDIMNKNQVNAPKRSMSDKKILQYESDLLSSSVNIDHVICIADLIPEERTAKFGGGDFTREDYAISWQKWKETGHRFVLTNIKHSNSKLLMECPDNFKKDTLVLIPDFIQDLAHKAKELLK